MPLPLYNFHFKFKLPSFGSSMDTLWHSSSASFCQGLSFCWWGLLMWEIGRRLGHYGNHPHPQVADRGMPSRVDKRVAPDREGAMDKQCQGEGKLWSQYVITNCEEGKGKPPRLFPKTGYPLGSRTCSQQKNIERSFCWLYSNSTRPKITQIGNRTMRVNHDQWHAPSMITGVQNRFVISAFDRLIIMQLLPAFELLKDDLGPQKRTCGYIIYHMNHTPIQLA